MSEAEDKSTRYDRSDLSARGIVYFMIALAITVVLIHLISWGMERYFAGSRVAPAPRNAAVIMPSAQASAKGTPALIFPAPQLQPDEVGDLNKFRAATEKQLDTAGTGHIPIEQAMEAVAKNGIPVRPQPVLPPRARFGSGDGTLAGGGGGTEPKGNL
ncbi:MAG: hypothetical protein LAN70_04055 [Acidobacteriia bacterium]|nr:hypothetical protein [Terriglobia bacterium]